VAAAVDVAEEPVWDLTDAIGDGRGADAVALLARLARGGAAPPLVLGALATHFRRLLRLRSGGNLGLPPFVRRKLEAQAQRYTESRLVACLGAIHETDIALKGSRLLGAPAQPRTPRDRSLSKELGPVCALARGGDLAAGALLGITPDLRAPQQARPPSAQSGIGSPPAGIAVRACLIAVRMRPRRFRLRARRRSD
jgi:hypothetical protein